MEPFQIISQHINDIWQRLPKLPPVIGVLTLSRTPISLKQRHRYNLIFLSKPVELVVDIPAFGNSMLKLPIGWIDLTLPEGSKVSLASGGLLSALYRCIDTLE